VRDDDYSQDIDNDMRRMIRHKVNQLIASAAFRRQDKDDLEQDIIVRVLQSLRSFDPNKGYRNKFIKAVIERHVANIFRNKWAAKRDPRRVGSLSKTIKLSEDEQCDLSECIGQRELDARRHYHPRSEEEQAQLAQDLADVIARLPENLRELAELLKTKYISEIARDKGIPRTTLRESVRRLRRRFEDTGLGKYL
jgi:RNA polymerase sigma-70 factor, ECF subfamily